MQARRLYKRYTDPAFPLIATRHFRRMINPVFVNIHWHSEIEFFYVSKGSFQVYDEGDLITADAGNLCVFLPGKHHCIRNLATDSEYWNIIFPLELIAMPESHFFQRDFVAPLRSGSMTIPKMLTPEQTAPMLGAMVTILQSKSNPERFSAVMDLCTRVMSYCTILPQMSVITAEHTAVQQCTQYIETHYANKLTLEDLAAQVHLHPNYLCTLFKNHTGETVFSFLARTRIQYAIKLLSQTRLPIAQVAERVGFSSSDFFSRKFKAIRGVTPHAYRKAAGKLKVD